MACAVSVTTPRSPAAETGTSVLPKSSVTAVIVVTAPPALRSPGRLRSEAAGGDLHRLRVAVNQQPAPPEP